MHLTVRLGGFPGTGTEMLVRLTMVLFPVSGSATVIVPNELSVEKFATRTIFSPVNAVLTAQCGPGF